MSRKLVQQPILFKSSTQCGSCARSMGAGVQRRAKTAWPAPSTRVAQRAQKIRVVTPEMLAERKKIAEEEAQWNMHKARTTLSELEVLMKAKRTEEGMDIIRLLGPGNPRSRFMILFALSDYSYRQFDELCVCRWLLHCRDGHYIVLTCGPKRKK